MASAEEPQQRQEQQVKERVHKTKLIQFLGRTTPIVLQNDNGPCPLLAICNVLLLRNNLNLSPDTVEVSQEKLLSLVAERLIDSNSNLDNKDAVYVENQQKNISDAIDLLPRLATGIDVNIKFRRIDDFEFTPECSIFDLLDIPLCHGWIVDPQDRETADAIGSKSYNGLTGELVALDTQNEEVACKKNISEEDCVDFAAATTATLGVPSPCLSKATSFDESPRSLSDHQKVRKGDLEEEALVSRALKLSLTTSVGDTLLEDVNGGTLSVGAYGSACPEEAVPVGSVDREKCIGLEENNFQRPDPSLLDDCSVRSNDSDLIFVKNSPGQAFGSSSQTDVGDHLVESASMESKEYILHNNVVENCSTDALLQSGSALSGSPRRESASLDESPMDISRGVEEVKNQSTTTTDVHESADTPGGCSTAELSCLASPNEDVELSSGRVQHIDASKSLSSIDDDEPIYEGEDRILNSRTAIPEDREPVYEGEMVLGKQPDKSPVHACNARSRDEITPQKGELIKNFLKNNASQLTIHGLFCLRDGLKERELCVFFRNNHFSTMFKFDGELYLLATDQGYINQPDLVWEKLNEVNGDTLFMTGNFREFQVESQTNDAWDEHGAMTSTADYLASIDNSAQEGNLNSDLQLAIALQQQEFEQQPQRRNPQQPSIGSSRLITGPQVPRNRNPPTPRPEAKKEKCTIM